MNTTYEFMQYVRPNSPVLWFTALCGNQSITDAFFSYDLTFNTPHPDVTTCFEYTFLVWLPAGMLLLLCLFSINLYYELPTVNALGASSRLDKLKKVVMGFLLVLYGIEVMVDVFIGRDLRHYELILAAASLRLLNGIIVFIYVDWRFRKGFHSSYVLLFYWLLLCVFDGIRVASQRIQRLQKYELNYSTPGLGYILYVEYLVELMLLVLHIPADDTASEQVYAPHPERLSLVRFRGMPKPKPKKPCPQTRASRLNNLLFIWFWKMVCIGSKRPLVFSDLYDVRPRDSSQYIHDRFSQYWSRMTAKPRYSPALVLGWALIRTCWDTMLPGCVMLTVQCLNDLINPLLLKAFISFVEDSDAYQWHGYLIVTCFVVLSLTNLITLQQGVYLNYITGMRMRVALTTSVYRKALKLSVSSVNVGEITNLMSIDAYKMQDNLAYMPFVIVTPLLVPFATYLLWQQLGGAALVGVLWYALVLPAAITLAGRVSKKFQAKLMILKDTRIRLTNQLLSGIKVWKFYAWEPALENKILDVREQELQQQRHNNVLFAFNQGIFFSSAFISSLLMFWVYLCVSGHSTPSVMAVFPSMAILNCMQFPLMMMPYGVSCLVQFWVSLKRLSKYLLKEELDTRQMIQPSRQDEAVIMNNCTVAWGGDALVLKKINLNIAKGSLVAIVGPVGSGKSSLISALLGEMDSVKGFMSVSGSIAYVPQQAWIQNMTLRDNILFSKPYIKERYQVVLATCCLLDDLKILTGGDLMEVGERGINLSGGQNQRVSLARACYQDNDIYVLDDPLSAVDAHVGKQIFNNVIGPHGMLRNKTRLMVTNSLTFVDKADHIVVLDKGQICESGSFSELISHEGPFAAFLREHLKSKIDKYNCAAAEGGDDDEEDDEDEEEIITIRRHLSSMSGSDSDFSSEYLSESDPPRVRRKVRLTRSMRMKKMDMRNEHYALTTEELMQTGSISLSVVKTFAQAASIPYLLAVVLGSAMTIVGNVVSNIWLNDWTSRRTAGYEDGHEDRQNADFGLGIYALIGVIFVSGVFLIALGGALGVVRASRCMHQLLLSTVLKLPMSFFDTTPKGRILNRFSKDVDCVDDQLRTLMIIFLLQLCIMCATIAAICYTMPLFTVVAIVLAGLFVGLQRTYIRIGRQLKRIESVRRSPVFAGFSETLSGLSSIRSYHQQRRFIEKADGLLDDSVRAHYLVVTANRWVGTYAGLISCCVILTFATFAVLDRENLDPGSVGLSLMYALTFNVQAFMILRTSCELENNVLSVERIAEYINLPTEAPHKIPGIAPLDNWPYAGQIEFRNFYMRYRPELELVLKGVSCRIRPGEKVGIVGRTGAGKSSMTLALFRIVEATAGTILIDGIDTSVMGLHDLRGSLSIIPQEPVVFSGTLRENLDPYERYSDDDIWHSLEKAHLKTFVSGLTMGLDFECGQDGSNMSVGQKQLLCLARALLRNPRLLILDEATASIDLNTDDLIQQTIRTEFKSTTILTIAHRLHTIMDYDRILVLDQGRLIELDTPDNLVKDSRSVFHSMARTAGLL